MKKLYKFLIIFFFVMTPWFYTSLIHAHNQDTYTVTAVLPMYLSTEEKKDPYDFPKIENTGCKSDARYREHADSVFQRCVFMPCGNGSAIPITLEDKNLVDRICADNQHYHPDYIRFVVARSFIINDAQQFIIDNNQYSCFRSDIFFDQRHFQHLSDAKNRTKKFKDACKKVLEYQHKQEKQLLLDVQKKEKSSKKNLSRSEKKVLKNEHDTQCSNLEAQ